MCEAAYGATLGARFQIVEPPCIVASGALEAELAVTEIRAAAFRPFLSGEMPYDDAFLAEVVLADTPGRQAWDDGTPLPARDLRTGDIVFHDLRRNPRTLVERGFHALHFYVPQRALDQIAIDMGRPRPRNLIGDRGRAISDGALAALAYAVLPALRGAQAASRLYAEHLLLAFAVHLACYHTDMPDGCCERGGLTARQLGRACELMSEHLGGDLPLRAVAQACDLSVSHFSRLFRTSTGVAPHQWILQRRVQLAQEKMGDQDLPLAEIALACGFADQSHMTRVFTRLVGRPPAAWRRAAAA